MEKINPEVIETVGKLMKPIADLNQQDFEEAMMFIAALALATLKHEKGDSFYGGFLEAAQKDPGNFKVMRNNNH